MSTSVRLGLVGRIETQSLYGERLLITGIRGRWLHVVAVTQPTHRDRRGYPGWVPARQVTTHAPVVRRRTATVVVPTTLLRTTTGDARLTVSFGTRLPVLATGETRTTVATPTGHRLTVRDSAVVLHARSARPLALTRSGVVTTARKFLGVTYLWGGRSGFAVDCSGFTNLVYGVHGVRIPRDADDQSAAGRYVALGSRRIADLMFFRHQGTIGHVGFYVGSGRLLHAPRTGLTVRVTRLSNMTGLARVRTFF